MCALSRITEANEGVARFAIVIGNNRADHESNPTLRYADDDAIATFELLEEAGVTARLLARFDADTKAQNPELRPHAAPTLADLVATVKALNQLMRSHNARGQETELLLFYSGHGGVAHGEGYVVLEGDRLTRTFLFEKILRRSGATRNHVVIDACKSFYLAFRRGPGGERQPYGRAFGRESLPSALSNTGFILSTSSDRDSHEWERFQAGVFSHEVRSGLRGAADVNRDGVVSYAELGAFLTVANEAITNPRFRPDFIVRPPGAPPGQLDRGLLAWNRERISLEVDSSEQGHLYVEDARGDRIADIHVAGGYVADLYLPVERPLFLRSNDEAREYELTEPSLARLSELRERAPLVARRGALHIAFSKLFQHPFGAENVAAFRRDFQLADEHSKSVPEPEPQLVSTAPSPRPSRTRTILGWTAIACVGIGAVANGWALIERSGNGDASHADRVEANDRIGQLNIAAVISYSVAAAAGATWLGMKLWGSKRRERRLSFEPTATSAGMFVSLEGVW